MREDGKLVRWLKTMGRRRARLRIWPVVVGESEETVLVLDLMRTPKGLTAGSFGITTARVARKLIKKYIRS